MPKIVQFTHPGPEHQPDKKNGNLKSWNTGGHKRKFLMCEGAYVDGNQLKESKLAFWGEWEPPSYVKTLPEKPGKFYPQWIHEPYLPEILPNSDGYQTSYQNTDPCVFDGAFKYFVCKQFKPKNRYLTPLAKLERGSMILFGSTANQNTQDAFFQLDTVFIVSDFIEYDIADPNALINANLGNYRNYVFKMAFPDPASFSLKLRLYIGATFQEPFQGMYSFSPSKIWENQQAGFPRIGLKNMEYLTDNLNAAPKVTEVSLENIFKFWQKIQTIIKTRGCVEGVGFKYRKNRAENLF
jgi:hypothetical protein